MQELTTLIKALNFDNYQELIKTYLKEKYKTTEVFIVNGPYDGGNDLVIWISGKPIKRNIQVTVTLTSLEKKLREDLSKAQENVSKYSYLNKLDFYYSQGISHSKKDELQLMAEVEYGIELKIIDSNILTQEFEHYTNAKRQLFKFFKLKMDDEFLKVDKQTKVVYDMLSNAQETGEMKKQFILSFIFTFLYASPASTMEEIIFHLNERLPNPPDRKFYLDNLSYLKGKGIVITDETKKKWSLSSEKTDEISAIYAQASLQENQLKEAIESVLNKFSLTDITIGVMEFLVEAYKSNYMIDLDELTGKNISVNSAVTKIYTKLKTFLGDKGVQEENLNVLTKELFTACTENVYLNKIGASILFTNLYESNKMEEYLNNRRVDIYLDTQVLLRLLCYQYKESEYDNLAYNSVKNFYETVRKSEYKIEVNTSNSYLFEVAAHIQEALRLQRFFDLPMFQNVRKSKNIFFNYYFHLIDSGEIESEILLDEFIEDLLGMQLPSFDEASFVGRVANRLNEIYDSLNINVRKFPFYDDFSLFKKEYEMQLAYDDRHRPSQVIDNDLAIIMYLSDLRNHLDPGLGIRNEPFLVTWDKEFYKFRQTVMNKFQVKGYGYFYIYSPAKLADRLAVTNFRLNPKSIDYNIISLTENNINLLYTSSSYLDIISLFFEKKDLSEIELAKKLLHIKGKNSPLEHVVGDELNEDLNDSSAILLSINKHYTSSTKYNFKNIIDLFEDNRYYINVWSVLAEGQATMKPNGDFNRDKLFSKLDALIEKKFLVDIKIDPITDKH